MHTIQQRLKGKVGCWPVLTDDSAQAEQYDYVLSAGAAHNCWADCCWCTVIT